VIMLIRGVGRSEKLRPVPVQIRPLMASLLSVIVLTITSITPATAQDTAPLFGIFDLQATNSNSYSNPYNFQEIELQGAFTAPSGATYNFFGFHAGDGSDGDIGNVWTLRFSPDEIGTWTYEYTWTDSTPGSTGSFSVVDTGLRGPLKVATDNSWFFEDARGNPFDARGYSLHQYVEGKYGRGGHSAIAVTDVIDKINTKVADRDYNLLMIDFPVYVIHPGQHFWQGNPDFDRFDVAMWNRVETILQAAADRGVYIFQFLALVDQETARPNDVQMSRYLRYMAARFGPYWNTFGYSPTWEYHDIWSDSQTTNVMMQLKANLNNLPKPPLLSVHDHSDNSFSGWLDFSMRQQQSTNVFAGNCRPCGLQGGVGSVFTDVPIIGSEDIWEYQSGDYGQPRNGDEVRRGAWGVQMAGVMPVYLEVGLADQIAPAGGRSNFSGQGEAEVRRMYDFFYTETRYREFAQLNNLVSSSEGQIASGVVGEQYLVYDQDGGSVTIDLSGTAATDVLTGMWFDPKSGEEQVVEGIPGGSARTLVSPYSQDSVLILNSSLGNGNGEPVRPEAITDLTANP